MIFEELTDGFPVKKGLFKFSRNPIFLGMLVSLLGVMLVAMNTLNVFNFILTYVLISIQIRLEEEYLNKAMKDEYSQYCILTPRWLGFRK
jgi:protein-S-isoprenylcysteine O-methyltransferase Ste14